MLETPQVIYAYIVQPAESISASQETLALYEGEIYFRKHNSYNLK